MLFSRRKNTNNDSTAWEESKVRAVKNVRETGRYQAQLADEAERDGDSVSAITWRNRSRESMRDARDIELS